MCDHASNHAHKLQRVHLNSKMDGASVNSSFVSYGSLTSGSSAGELESDIGRDALREICCSVLSRILDLSDNKLEVLMGFLFLKLSQ